MTYSISNYLRKSRGKRAISLAAALAILFATQSFAQDAGVSGIPAGPGNVNGLNGSVRDPSGIGNASRMPALPRPSVAPVTPSVSAGGRSVVRPGITRARIARGHRSRFLSAHARHRAERAAVKENDRLLKHGVVSICRGC
jgi:hypothetical protein